MIMTMNGVNRKFLIGFLFGLASILGLTIVVVPSPDLSVELELRKQVIQASILTLLYLGFPKLSQMLSTGVQYLSQIN